MVRKLSEQLADLSARAKQTEDSFAAAQQDARDKLAARKEKARVATTAAMARFQHRVDTLGDEFADEWSAAKAKIKADISALEKRVKSSQHAFDAMRARERAEQRERDAELSIDYAIAAVEQANFAVLDAIDARAHANAVSA